MPVKTKTNKQSHINPTLILGEVYKLLENCDTHKAGEIFTAGHNQIIWFETKTWLDLGLGRDRAFIGRAVFEVVNLQEV